MRNEYVEFDFKSNRNREEQAISQIYGTPAGASDIPSALGQQLFEQAYGDQAAAQANRTTYIGAPSAEHVSYRQEWRNRRLSESAYRDRTSAQYTPRPAPAVYYPQTTHSAQSSWQQRRVQPALRDKLQNRPLRRRKEGTHWLWIGLVNAVFLIVLFAVYQYNENQRQKSRYKPQPTAQVIEIPLGESANYARTTAAEPQHAVRERKTAETQAAPAQNAKETSVTTNQSRTTAGRAEVSTLQLAEEIDRAIASGARNSVVNYTWPRVMQAIRSGDRNEAVFHLDHSSLIENVESSIKSKLRTLRSKLN